MGGCHGSVTGGGRGKRGTTLTNSYNASVIGYAGTGAGLGDGPLAAPALLQPGRPGETRTRGRREVHADGGRDCGAVWRWDSFRFPGGRAAGVLVGSGHRRPR